MVAAFVVAAEAVKGGGVEIDAVAENFIAADTGGVFPAAGKWQGVNGFTGRNWTFLILSGLATGASWLAYFKALQLGNASQVAPVDKFSLVLVALMAVVFLDDRPCTE